MPDLHISVGSNIVTERSLTSFWRQLHRKRSFGAIYACIIKKQNYKNIIYITRKSCNTTREKQHGKLRYFLWFTWKLKQMTSYSSLKRDENKKDYKRDVFIYHKALKRTDIMPTQENRTENFNFPHGSNGGMMKDQS